MTPEEQQELELLEEGIGRLARRAVGKIRHSVGGVRPWNFGKTNLDWKEHLYRRDRRGKFVDQNKADPPSPPRSTPFDAHVTPDSSPTRVDADGDGILNPKDVSRLVSRILRMREGDHTPLHDLIAAINRMRHLQERKDGKPRPKIQEGNIWKITRSGDHDTWEVRWRDQDGNSHGKKIRLDDLRDEDGNYDPNRLLGEILAEFEDVDLHDPEVVGDWAPGFCGCGCGSVIHRKDILDDKGEVVEDARKFLPGHEIRAENLSDDAKDALNDVVVERDNRIDTISSAVDTDGDTFRRDFFDDVAREGYRETIWKRIQAKARGKDENGMPIPADFANQKEVNAYIRRRWADSFRRDGSKNEKKEVSDWVKNWTEWAHEIEGMRDDNGKPLNLDPFDPDVQRQYGAPTLDPRNPALFGADPDSVGDKIGSVPKPILKEAARRSKETGRRHYVYFDPTRAVKYKDAKTGKEVVDWGHPDNYVISDTWQSYDSTSPSNNKPWRVGANGNDVPNYNSHGLLMLRSIADEEGEHYFIYSPAQLNNKVIPPERANRVSTQQLLNQIQHLRMPPIAFRKKNVQQNKEALDFNGLVEQVLGDGFIGEDVHKAAQAIDLRNRPNVGVQGAGKARSNLKPAKEVSPQKEAAARRENMAAGLVQDLANDAGIENIARRNVVDEDDPAQRDAAVARWWRAAVEHYRKHNKRNLHKYTPEELLDGLAELREAFGPGSSSGSKERTFQTDVWEKRSPSELGLPGASGITQLLVSRDQHWAVAYRQNSKTYDIYEKTGSSWKKVTRSIDSDDWFIGPVQDSIKTLDRAIEYVAALQLRKELDNFREAANKQIEGIADKGRVGDLGREITNALDKIGDAVFRDMKRQKAERLERLRGLNVHIREQNRRRIQRPDDDGFGRGVLPDGPGGVPGDSPDTEAPDDPYPSRIDDLPEKSPPPRVPDVEVDEEAVEAHAREAADAFERRGTPEAEDVPDVPEDAPEVEEPSKPINPKNRQHAQAAAASKRSDAEKDIDGRIIFRSGEYSYYEDFEYVQDGDKDYYVSTLKRRDTSLDPNDEFRDVEITMEQFVVTEEHQNSKIALLRDIKNVTDGFRDLVRKEVEERAKWGKKDKDRRKPDRESIERAARTISDSPEEVEDLTDQAIDAQKAEEEAEREAKRQAALDGLVRMQHEDNDFAAMALDGLDVDVDADKEDDPDEVLHLADAGAAQLPVQRVDKAVDSNRDEFFARDAGVVDGVRDIPVVKSRRVIRPVDNMATVEINDGREPDNFGIRRNVRVWQMKEKHGGGKYVLDMHPDGYGRLWYYGKDGQEVLLDDRINVNAHSANKHGFHVEEIIDRHVDGRYDPDLNMRKREPIEEDPDDLLLHLADEGRVQVPARRPEKILDDERGGFFAREMGFVDDAEDDEFRRVYTLVHVDEKGSRRVVAEEIITPDQFDATEAEMVQKAKEHNEAAKGAGRFLRRGEIAGVPSAPDSLRDQGINPVNVPLRMRDMDGNEWEIEYGNPFTNEQGEARQPVRVKKVTVAGVVSHPISTDIAWDDDDAKLSLEQDKVRKLLEMRIREEQMRLRLGDVDEEILEEIVAGDVVKSPYGRGDRIIGKGKDGKYRYIMRYGNYTNKDGREVELYARIDFWWGEDVERKDALREELKRLEPGTEAYEKKQKEIEEVPPRIYAKENDKTEWVRDPLERQERLGKWVAQIRDKEGRAVRNPDMRPGAAAHKLPKVKGDIDAEDGKNFAERIQERRALQNLGLEEDPFVVEAGWEAVQDAISRKGFLEYQDETIDKITEVKVFMVEIDSNIWDSENERWARIRVPHAVMRAVVKTSAQDRVEMQYTIDHTGYIRSRKWDPQFPNGGVLKLDGKDFYSTELVWDGKEGFQNDDLKVMHKFKNDRAKGIAARDIKPPKDKGPAKDAKLLKDGGWEKIGENTYKKDNFILKKTGMGWRVYRKNSADPIAGGPNLEKALEKLDENPVWRERDRDEPDLLSGLEEPDDEELRAIERDGVDSDADISLGPDLDEVEDAVSHEGLPDPVAGDPLPMEPQYHPNLNNRAAWRVIQDVALHEVPLADDPDARGMYVWYDGRENVDDSGRVIGWRYGPNKPDDAVPGIMIAGYVHPYDKKQGPRVAVRPVAFDANGKRLGADYPEQWIDPDGNKEIAVEHVNEKFSDSPDNHFNFPGEWHPDPEEMRRQAEAWDAIVDEWRKADAAYEKSVERKYVDPVALEREQVDVARINSRSDLEFYNQKESWDAWNPTGPDIFDGAPEGVEVGFDGRRYYTKIGDQSYYTDRKPSAAWVQRRIDYDRQGKAAAPHLLDVLDVGELDTEGREQFRASAVRAVFGSAGFEELARRGLAGQLPDGRMVVRVEALREALADDPDWDIDGAFLVMKRGRVKDQFDDLMQDLRADMGAQFGVDDQFDGQLHLIDGRVNIIQTDIGELAVLNEGPAGNRNVAGVGGSPLNGSLSMSLDVDSLIEQPWWQDPASRRLQLNRVLTHELGHIISNKDGRNLYESAGSTHILGMEEGLVEGMSAAMVSDIAKRHGWSADFTPRTTTGLLNDMMSNDPDKASPYWHYLQNLEYVRDRLGMDHKSFYAGLSGVPINERRNFLKRMVLSDDIPGAEGLIRDIDRMEALMDARLQMVMLMNMEDSRLHLWDADAGNWRSMAEVNNRHRDLINLLRQVPDDHPDPDLRAAAQTLGPTHAYDSPLFAPEPFQDAHTPRRQGFSEFQFPGSIDKPDPMNLPDLDEPGRGPGLRTDGSGLDPEDPVRQLLNDKLFGGAAEQDLQIHILKDGKGQQISVEQLRKEGYLEAAAAAFGWDKMSPEDQVYMQNHFLGSNGRLLIRVGPGGGYSFALHSRRGSLLDEGPARIDRANTEADVANYDYIEFVLDYNKQLGTFKMRQPGINLTTDVRPEHKKPDGFGTRFMNFQEDVSALASAKVSGYRGKTAGTHGGKHWWLKKNRGRHRGLRKGDKLPKEDIGIADTHFNRIVAMLDPDANDLRESDPEARQELLNGRKSEFFWIEEHRSNIAQYLSSPDLERDYDSWLRELRDSIIDVDGDASKPFVRPRPGRTPIQMQMEKVVDMEVPLPDNLRDAISAAGGDPDKFTFRGKDLLHGEDEIPIFQDF